MNEFTLMVMQRNNKPDERFFESFVPVIFQGR